MDGFARRRHRDLYTYLRLLAYLCVLYVRVVAISISFVSSLRLETCIHMCICLYASLTIHIFAHTCILFGTMRALLSSSPAS
jgi:hypothetical protein